MPETKIMAPVQANLNKDEDLIVAEVRSRHPDAEKFKFMKSMGDFLGGTVYYIEYESKESKKEDLEDENFYYAYVGNGSCRLYDDGMNIIEWCIDALEKRKTLMQRINDFELHELISSVIALAVVGAFIVLLTTGGINNAKDVLPIFSLVLGYYFGQGKGGK